MIEITTLLVVVTAIISISAFSSEKLMDAWILDPYKMKATNQWYRFITSGFLHADWLHLIINMFVLYSFGQWVEQYYRYFFEGKAAIMFLLLYLSSLVAASASTYYRYQNSPGYRSLGASGAVSAITTASILFAPLTKIYLYGIIGIPNIIAGILYLIYSQYASRQMRDNINHEAHFYGAVYGVVFTLVANPRIFPFFLSQF